MSDKSSNGSNAIRRHHDPMSQPEAHLVNPNQPGGKTLATFLEVMAVDMIRLEFLERDIIVDDAQRLFDAINTKELAAGWVVAHEVLLASSQAARRKTTGEEFTAWARLADHINETLSQVCSDEAFRGYLLNEEADNRTTIHNNASLERAELAKEELRARDLCIRDDLANNEDAERATLLSQLQSKFVGNQTITLSGKSTFTVKQMLPRRCSWRGDDGLIGTTHYTLHNDSADTMIKVSMEVPPASVCAANPAAERSVLDNGWVRYSMHVPPLVTMGFLGVDFGTVDNSFAESQFPPIASNKVLPPPVEKENVQVLPVAGDKRFYEVRELLDGGLEAEFSIHNCCDNAELIVKRHISKEMTMAFTDDKTVSREKHPDGSVTLTVTVPPGKCCAISRLTLCTHEKHLQLARVSLTEDYVDSVLSRRVAEENEQRLALQKRIKKADGPAEHLRVALDAGLPFVDYSFDLLGDFDAVIGTVDIKRRSELKGALGALGASRSPWLHPGLLQGSLFGDRISSLDPGQGLLGNCYLLAAMTALSHVNPKFIVEKIFGGGTNNKESAAGAYRLNLVVEGFLTEVIIDGVLPTSSGDLVFGRNFSATQQLWVPLLEKAMAKIHGSYAAIEKSDIYRAIRVLTGFPANTIAHTADIYGERDKAMEVFGELQACQEQGCPIYCSTSLKTADGKALSSEEFDKKGLSSTHGYAILKVVEEGEHKLLLLRNAHNGDDVFFKGKFHPDDPLWNTTPALKRIRDENLPPGKNGVFWMSLEDALLWFDDFGACYLRPGWTQRRVASHISPDDAAEGTTVALLLTVTEEVNVMINLEHRVTKDEKARRLRIAVAERFLDNTFEHNGTAVPINDMLASLRKHRGKQADQHEPGTVFRYTQFSAHNIHPLSSGEVLYNDCSGAAAMQCTLRPQATGDPQTYLVVPIGEEADVVLSMHSNENTNPDAISMTFTAIPRSHTAHDENYHRGQWPFVLDTQATATEAPCQRHHGPEAVRAFM